MGEIASLTPEEKELLRSVVRKRQPSMLWVVGSDKPPSPAQRDSIKGMLMDEMREAGGPLSERGSAIKKVLDRLAQA